MEEIQRTGKQGRLLRELLLTIAQQQTQQRAKESHSSQEQYPWRQLEEEAREVQVEEFAGTLSQKLSTAGPQCTLYAPRARSADDFDWLIPSKRNAGHKKVARH